MSATRSSLFEVWRFPLRTHFRRRDIAVGGALFLLLPILGWLLNLGHRWRVMERLYHSDPPWFRGFRPLRGTLMRGIGVATLFLAYVGPGVLLAFGSHCGSTWNETQLVIGTALALAAFYAFPIAICRFAQSGAQEWMWFWGHGRAFLLALRHGVPYLEMWIITWTTIGISVLPLLAAFVMTRSTGETVWWFLTLPFFGASPWAWSALAFGFGTILVPETMDHERACDLKTEGRS